MARRTVEFNNAYFENLSREAGVKRLVDDVAERVLAAAIESAPVASGDYKAGLHIEEKDQKRRVVLVKGSDPKTMLIEAKTGNLARALRKGKRS